VYVDVMQVCQGVQPVAEDTFTRQHHPVERWLTHARQPVCDSCRGPQQSWCWQHLLTSQQPRQGCRGHRQCVGLTPDVKVRSAAARPQLNSGRSTSLVTVQQQPVYVCVCVWLSKTQAEHVAGTGCCVECKLTSHQTSLV
jgi:hypothetical protein